MLKALYNELNNHQKMTWKNLILMVWASLEKYICKFQYWLTLVKRYDKRTDQTIHQPM
jgi:hypothetical protein